jgi:PPOX class probable F420-dependent enzyme
MSTTAGLGVFQAPKYLNIETFRNNGKGVQTPVWFAAAPGGPLYVYSTADSGKAKRIRNNGICKIAPCDARGKVTGAWVDARAEFVAGDEAVRGMGLINRKYWPLKLVFDLFIYLSKHHERVVIAIHPA